MKKSKKIPKTHLPKFTAGGGTTRTLANGNQVSDAKSSTEGTQNIYNDKRSSKLNIGQYANYATAAVNLGVGLSNNQKLSGAAKNQANANTINSTIDSVAGSVTPWYGYAKTASGIGKSLTSPNSVTDPTTGETVTQSSNRTNQAFSDTFTPMHETTINKASEGDWGGAALNTITGGVWNTMDNYLNGTNQKKFDKAKANEASYNQQQTDLANQQNAAAQKQQTDYINSAIQSGLANQQPQSSYVQYAMGGMNMQPNAEVEGGGYGKDGENTLNPDGTATQFNGPTHEQGGIKTNLDPGTLIFSDKVKWDGKTAADHNKPYTRIIQKATKDLENSSLTKESKLSAHLNLMAATKASQAIFAKQEETKQSKIDSYTKRLGGIMKYPNYNQFIPGINQSKQPIQTEEFKKGGVKLPQYDEGGSFIDGVWVPNSSYKPGTMGFNDSGNTPNNPSNYSLQSSYNPNVLPWNRTNDSKQGPNGKSEQYVNDNPQQQFQEVTSNSKSNIGSPKVTDPNDKNFDWKGLGTQALSFAANNAGNIFDLARADKTETRRYDKMTAKLLDPTAAIRDAVSQTRRAEYNIRNASSGNAGTYLANRVGLNAQNTENIARIHQNYENANAGITNQTSQYNTGIANDEILANAKIRANARNIKQSAVASIGSNSANQMNDVRNTEMDKKKMDGLIKMYPSLSKDPKMLEYFMSFNA